MFEFNYSLIKICFRAGRGYYHIYPETQFNLNLEQFQNFKLTTKHPKYAVINFPDCNVTVFSSGRMLIEDLPQDSEKRAKEIVDQIISQSE